MAQCGLEGGPTRSVIRQGLQVSKEAAEEFLGCRLHNCYPEQTYPFSTYRKCAFREVDGSIRYSNQHGILHITKTLSELDVDIIHSRALVPSTHYYYVIRPYLRDRV